MLPDDTPWLIAVKPELNSHETPVLPHHGRLRGHLDDPLFAECDQRERIFVVDEVLAAYATQLPSQHPMWSEAPAGFEQWPRYDDRQLGFSIAYPPDWTAEPLVEATLLGGVVLRSPEHPTYPVFVRVHEGETHWDYFDPFNEPPLLQETLGRGVFEQSGMIWSWPDSQRLSGLQIDREAREDEYSMAILFSSNGRTYEIALTYPTGFNASQELLTNYSTIEESFRLDVLPGPSPTPAIKQELGAGPFIGREEAETAALSQNETPEEFEIIDTQLIPEAEARRLVDDCEMLPGHPEGVWLVRGQDEAATFTIDWFLNATTGEMLTSCSYRPSPTPDPNIFFPTLPPDVPPPPTPAP
jgi:hypothetical protein